MFLILSVDLIIKRFLILIENNNIRIILNLKMIN